MATRLSPRELVNKANTIVDAQERGEEWDVTGISPRSRARLVARVEHERRTRAAIRRLSGRVARSRKVKRGKARKSKRR
jgi:hypothetical protein